LRAAQVQHQVKTLLVLGRAARKIDGASRAASLDAIAVSAATGQVNLVVQTDGLLRAGGHTGIAAGAQVQVDRVAGGPGHIECPEPAAQAFERSGHHRVTPVLTAPGLARAFGPKRDLQRIGQQIGRALGRIQRPQDQQAPFAFVGHGGHRLRLGQAGSRQQGGHLGRGLRTFTAPACGFPDVDEADRGHSPFGLPGQLGKQALFLGTGHHHGISPLDCALKSARLAATQGGVFGQFLTQRPAQGAGLQGQGLVAIANQGGHVVGAQPSPK